MNKDDLRHTLRFYQDLGVTDLYRVAARSLWQNQKCQVSDFLRLSPLTTR